MPMLIAPLAADLCGSSCLPGPGASSISRAVARALFVTRAVAMGTVLTTLLPLSALAQDESSAVETQMQAIDAAREALAARRLTEEKACYQRFAVNGCLADVRDRFVPQKAELRRRELAVRDGERARKEGERLARLQDAQQAERRNEEAAARRAASAVSLEQRQAEVLLKQEDREAAEPQQRARAEASRARAERSVEQARQEQARRAAEAPAERGRFERKQQDAAERRAAREQKLRESEANPKAARPPPKPLRVPEKPLAAPLPAAPGPAAPS